MDEMIKAIAEVAKTIAGRLTNQNYRFVVLIIIIASTFAVYITTNSPQLAIALLVVGLLSLLLALLLGQKNPHWTLTANQIFALLVIYLIIVIMLVGYMFWTFTRQFSPAQQQDNAWVQSHNQDAVALSEGLYGHLRSIGLIDAEGAPLKAVTQLELTQAINTFALENTDNRVRLYKVAHALEDYEACRADKDCLDSTIDDRFLDRMGEFWRNFKCSIAQLRETGGYDDLLAESVKQRYESETRWRGTGPRTDSFEVCKGAIQLAGRDCPPLQPAADRSALLDRGWPVTQRPGSAIDGLI